MSVFFTSDLHFGHKILIEGLRNMSIDECHNKIITNWNKIVNKKDLVYVLGDVTMENPKYVDILKQLHGIIYVIGGNHDTRKCCQALNSLGIPVMGCMDYKGFLVTHVPVIGSELYGRGNIHGHIHSFNTTNIHSCGQRYYNVNCEYHNYTPVPFETIRDYFDELANKALEIW